MKQNDISENLEKWNNLDRYSRWMYHSYKKYIGNRILDIGAGIGNLTRFLIENGECVIGVDIFDKQIEIMNKRFAQHCNFNAINFNFLEDDLEKLRPYKFDTVVCVNVLEHLENDILAIKKMKEILEVNGKIIILVPAWKKLYSYLDKNVGHYRRYDRGELKKLAERCNMSVIQDKYFNFWGILPYYLKGKLVKDKGGSFSTDLKVVDSKFYNVASVILEPIENLLKPPIGLSEIIVLKKV